MIHRELTARRQRKDGGAEHYDRPDHHDDDDDAGMEGVVEEVTTITTNSRRPWHDFSDQELWAVLEQMDQEYADDENHDEEEEMEQMMALEHQYWDEQYEQWRIQQQGYDCDDDDDDWHDAGTTVPCPMCYQGRLVQDDDEEGSNVICCSNHHDSMNHMMADDDDDDRFGSCPFRMVLPRHDNDHRPLTLADLADRLRIVHQDHARLGCRQQLPRIMIQQSMQVDNDQQRQPTTTLVTAHCAACGMQRRIV
jgi:hypothetical protein